MHCPSANTITCAPPGGNRSPKSIPTPSPPRDANDNDDGDFDNIIIRFARPAERDVGADRSRKPTRSPARVARAWTRGRLAIDAAAAVRTVLFFVVEIRPDLSKCQLCQIGK